MSATVPPPLPPPRRVAPPPPAKVNSRELLFRLVVVVVLIASLVLTWWTLAYGVAPVQRHSRELTSDLSRLSAEVDTLDRKWSPADVEQIRKQYTAARATLFGDAAALTAWLNGLETRASPLALDVKVDFGKSVRQETADEKLAVIPTAVSLDVRPHPDPNASPYQRVLFLSWLLALEEGKRADLAELTVTGGANSISRAVLVFNLWAGAEGNQ